jgi:molecular chaperone DnaK
VNPSEAVALGAGVQGAIVAGEPIEAILVDVTPYSLGIAVADVLPMGALVDDRFKPLIHRNTTIPTTQREVFQTLHPGQTSAEIEVYQGESPIASQNALLGKFLFENLVPESPGVPARVTVQFDIDASGMLTVRVLDRGSRQETGITVKASRQRLSHAEIQSARLTLPEIGEQADLPEGLIRQTEVLVGRATMLARQNPDGPLQEAIDTVNIAWQMGDEAMLRDALEVLTDILYELEDES